MAEVAEHVAEHDRKYMELDRHGLGHYVEHGLEHALQLWRLRASLIGQGYETEGQEDGGGASARAATRRLRLSLRRDCTGLRARNRPHHGHRDVVRPATLECEVDQCTRGLARARQACNDLGELVVLHHAPESV